MFSTISQANASTTAMTNTTPAGLDMSLESLVYTGPNKLPLPKLNTILLDNPDDDSPFLLSPPPFTPERPAAVHIQQDVHQEVHHTKEGKAHADAVEGLLKLKGLDPCLTAATVRQRKEEAQQQVLDLIQAKTSVEAAKNHVFEGGQFSSEVCIILSKLHGTMCAYWKTPTQPPNEVQVKEETTSDSIDDWTFDSSSNWTDDKDEEYKCTWPTPSQTPPQGNEDHPPSTSICGEHPGMGWELNMPGTTHYYRFLIPDPTTNCTVVAPYLTYFINCECPKVSATWGKGYPIQSRLLEPLQVDYFCPAMTPKQMGLLDPQASCMPAINKVLNEYFSYHISATIRQYQYYHNTQISIQQMVKHLQDKEYKYLEKAMEVLSRLESTNFMGRLLAHENIIHQCLSPTLESLASWSHVRDTFRSEITWSALDPTINPFRSSPPLTRNSICICIDRDPSMNICDPRKVCIITPEHVTAAKHQRQTALTDKEKRVCAFIRHCDPEVTDIKDFMCALHDEEEFDCKHCHIARVEHDRLHPCHPLSVHRVCHKCGERGHICAQCKNKAKHRGHQLGHYHK
jgi:hypothetical protein